MTISLVWRVLLYGWLASEIFIAIATRTRRGGGKVNDRGSMLILWLMITASITACNWIAGARGPNLPGSAHHWKLASVLVIAAGLILRAVAIFSLGKSFSANVAIRHTQTVYREGLYRLVRHPSYSGLLIVFLAIGLHTQNWHSLAAVLLPTTAALLYRIHVEEAALKHAFGPEYDQYIRETKRLIPGLY